MSQPLSINTTHDHDVCDICARTLLRGERTEAFVNAGRRYNVCELCKPHALHEGWMREGAIPDRPSSPERAPRRRALFGRRRNAGRRQAPEPPAPPRTLDDELSFDAFAPPPHGGASAIELTPLAAPLGGQDPFPDQPREPRHVHAIPARDEHRIVAAADAFNASEHRRTVAGVGRSLGVPGVNLTPDQTHAACVWVVVAWELCWYRYEVDLSDVRANVRLDAQGYELSELAEYERAFNCGCDESGALLPF